VSPPDDGGVAPPHVQELGDACPVECARPALEEDVILGPRRDFLWEAGLCRGLDNIGEWRHAGIRRKVGRQHGDVGAIGAADGGRVDYRHASRPRYRDQLNPGIQHGAHRSPPRGADRCVRVPASQPPQIESETASPQVPS
jgi:hypothetical protein